MDREVTLYILLAVLLLMVIPLFYQLWRAVEQLTIALRTLNSRLPSILHNLDEISGNLKETTSNVNARVSDLSAAFQKVQAFLGAFQGAKQVAGAKRKVPLLPLLHNARPILKGVKMFLHVLKAGQEEPR